MKLIDILVEELPKRGGWPKGAKCITQDGDRKVEPASCHPSVAKCDGDGFWFLDSSRIGGFEVDAIASDYTTAIITREQYEAALAASKSCTHDFVPSEGRTASGVVCRKCGDYNGPESETKADDDGWIDWAGGECPLENGTIIDAKDRDGYMHFGEVIGATNNVDDIFWQRGVCSYPCNEIIAYRLHKPQEATEADGEADLNECIGQTTAPVWSGGGLPPVGCECEVSVDGGRSWCTYRAINEKNGARLIEIGNFTEEFQNNNWIFRPIRSQAERKREEAVQALCDAGGGNGKVDEKSGYGSSWFDVYDAIAAGKIPGVKLDN